jgi:dinuclear metal center YbgI/SA1388 family protein
MAQRKRKYTVAEVAEALAALAPPAYAEAWDNVGLIAGWRSAAVARVLLAIDLTDAVAAEALDKRVDLLVTYHPPIHKGIRTVTADAASPTALLPDLLAARISIIALHTALDAAEGGTNDVLLDAVGAGERVPLGPHVAEDEQYKLVVFVPPAEVDALRAALSAAGAGVIGHYSACSYELAGRGTFRGDESTRPTVGRKLRLEVVEETRLEMVVERGRLGDVVRALYAAHSYEEPAFDLYPLQRVAGRGRIGPGRVGVLDRPTTGTALLRRLGAVVDLGAALVVGGLKRRFRTVTAAAGAFGIDRFRDPESLVLTGEFKHHDALQLLKRGVTAVHLGHAASERPVLPVVQRRLRGQLRGLRVEIARRDRSPLVPITTRS